MPNHAERYRSGLTEFLAWLANEMAAALLWLAAWARRLGRRAVDVAADLVSPAGVSPGERAGRIATVALACALLAWGALLVVGG